MTALKFISILPICIILFSLCSCSEKNKRREDGPNTGDKSVKAPSILVENRVTNNPELPFTVTVYKSPDEELAEFLKVIEYLGSPESEGYKNRFSQVWGILHEENFTLKDREFLTNQESINLRIKELHEDSFENHEVPFVADDLGKVKMKWLVALANHDADSGGHALAPILINRANSSSINGHDLANLYAVSKAIVELTPYRGRPVLEDWEILAESQNPIYRLLALKASVASSPIAAGEISIEEDLYNTVCNDHKDDFYLKYRNEENLYVLTNLIKVLETGVYPNTKDQLKENHLVKKTSYLKILLNK